MLVTIDGVDGSGKSTLAERIVRDLGVRTTYVHTQKPTSHPLDFYLRPLVDYNPAAESRVLDRWVHSEVVYPGVFGRESELDIPTYAYIDLFMESRGAVFVHATGTPENIRYRMSARGEDWLKPEQAEEVIFKYELVRDSTEISAVFEHTVEEPVDLAELERTGYQRAVRSSRILRITREYVGALAPDVLLVGDQQNPRSSWFDAGLPFVPVEASCGHWLFGVLGGFDSYGVTNSTAAVRDLWEELAKPQLVALGNRAHARLEAEALDHGSVPHPQYFRRFHHRYRDEYRSALRAAASGVDARDISRTLAERWQ